MLAMVPQPRKIVREKSGGGARRAGSATTFFSLEVGLG